MKRLKLKTRQITAVLTMILFATVMGIGIASATGLPVMPIVAVFLIGYTIMSFAPKMNGILGVGGLQVEIWQAEIIKNLFKDNAFLQYCNNEDQYVLNGSVVHIPQAGTPTGAERNRTQLPAAIKRRNDTDVTYLLDEFSTNPDFIPNADTIELSYDKMQSVLDEKLASLKELLAEWMLYNWRPTLSAHIIRTTGGAVLSHLPSATGNRKLLVNADLKKARKLMNKLNIPKENRFAMLDSEMYDQLTTDFGPTTYRDAVRDMNLPEGTLGKLHGFYLLERSTALRADNTATPVIKDPDASDAAADNAGVLCWHKETVARAMGTIKPFQDLNNPVYFGDIYSFLVKAGGRKRRADGAGVIAIVQEATT